jgi:hypothetical protein
VNNQQKSNQRFSISQRSKKPDTPTKETPVDDKKIKRRERLLANLAKGRATSLLNRQKKALFNKIKKEEANDVIEDAIKQKVMKKSKLDLLREQVKQLTMAKQNNLLKPESKQESKPEQKQESKPEPPVEKIIQPKPVQKITLSTYSSMPW